MTEETRKQIIKAFVYSMPISLISEAIGVDKDEITAFADDYKEAIAAEMAYSKKKGEVNVNA